MRSQVLAAPVTRRRLFAAAGGVGILLSAGCNPFSSEAPKSTVTVTASTPPAADPMAGLVAVTRLQVLRLGAAVAADQTNAPRYTLLLGDRQKHYDALVAEWARTDPAAAPSSTVAGVAPPAVDMPTDAAEIVGAIRQDAIDAQGQFTDALALVSRYRATLFASIAACLASHQVVLT